MTPDRVNPITSHNPITSNNPITSHNEPPIWAPLARHHPALPALAEHVGTHTPLDERDVIAECLIEIADRSLVHEADDLIEIAEELLVCAALGNSM